MSRIQSAFHHLDFCGGGSSSGFADAGISPLLGPVSGAEIASEAFATLSTRQPGAGKNHMANRISNANVAATNKTHAHFISPMAHSRYSGGKSHRPFNDSDKL